MNSIISVDETWTISTFKRQYMNADEILRLNNLPNSSCPYSTIANQLYNLDYQRLKQMEQGGAVFDYYELEQANAVKANLTDSIRAEVISDMTPAEFIRYAQLGSMPNNLIVPALYVDEIEPVPNYLQAQILKLQDMPDIQEIMRKNQPVIQVPIDTTSGNSNQDSWYWKPTGEVTIQVEGEELKEIPCYPEEVSDSVTATWSQEMTTYQHYEPQNTYKQSGPRVVACVFKIHRAMWDGNQDSGESEALVSYMQSACYPDYDTQAAEPPRVTLIIGKSIRVVGILTSMDTKYSGPIGIDGKYDCVDISISITEESDNVLSTKAVRSGLAGWR